MKRLGLLPSAAELQSEVRAAREAVAAGTKGAVEKLDRLLESMDDTAESSPDSVAHSASPKLSRVHASTFSRRAPSGELGASWEWDNTAHKWLRPSKASSPSSVVQLEARASAEIVEAPPPEAKVAPAAARAQPPMTEDELRARLRPLFDKFDVDGGGSISTGEMTNILTQLKIEMSAEQIGDMMREADPDGSGRYRGEAYCTSHSHSAPVTALLLLSPIFSRGSVDFDEFCAVLTKQMEAGGQLASVVDSASSFFGFLNPFR